jgi:hypothetical protein
VEGCFISLNTIFQDTILFRTLVEHALTVHIFQIGNQVSKFIEITAGDNKIHIAHQCTFTSMYVIIRKNDKPTLIKSIHAFSQIDVLEPKGKWPKKKLPKWRAKRKLQFLRNDPEPELVGSPER